MNPTEEKPRLLVCRAANQAARAVVKVIETQTGKEVSLYDCMRLVNVVGAALERNGFEGGPSGEIRAILEQPYVPRSMAANDEQAIAHAIERLENDAIGCENRLKAGTKYHAIDSDQLGTDIRTLVAAWFQLTGVAQSNADAAKMAEMDRDEMKANLNSTQRHLNGALVEIAQLNTQLTEQADEFNREKAMIRELLSKHI